MNRFGLVLRGSAGKQSDLSSVSLRLAFVLKGCCLWTVVPATVIENLEWLKPLPPVFMQNYSGGGSVASGTYSPLSPTSFHKFSRQLATFAISSSGLISALLVLSSNVSLYSYFYFIYPYLFMKISLSPNIILCG